MDKLNLRIRAELENIDSIFEEIPNYKKLPYLSTLELAGVAALIHNFYNGIENILKQILKAKGIEIPTSKSWHKELLNISEHEKIISEKLKIKLGEFLAFRHYFSHAYALDLYSEKMEPLVEKSKFIYEDFKESIKAHYKQL
jgi:uncharacterized protein YutE (UPF0331/DUF86 family)